jgi:hypothetical protein
MEGKYGIWALGMSICCRRGPWSISKLSVAAKLGTRLGTSVGIGSPKSVSMGELVADAVGDG